MNAKDQAINAIKHVLFTTRELQLPIGGVDIRLLEQALKALLEENNHELDR